MELDDGGLRNQRAVMHSQYNDEEGQPLNYHVVPVRRPESSDGKDRDDPSAGDYSLSPAGNGARFGARCPRIAGGDGWHC